MKKIYSDWDIPIRHYLQIVTREEVTYEIVIPIIIGIAVSAIYSYAEGTLSGLLKLRDLLPTSIAILIGFTITCISMLASSEATNIKALKETKFKKRDINGVVITLYQGMLILFSYQLTIQVFLLLFTFFVAFILRIYSNAIFMFVLMSIEVSILLHIMLILVRSISYVYLSLYPNKKDEHS